jgi:cobyrinic acid a,c-diamide synthase
MGGPLKFAFMLAAPYSGSGKTLASVLFAHLLTQRGLELQTFKVGPDFIDPLHLSQISGRPCIQLDRFFLDERGIKELFCRYVNGVDAVLVEGTMGLFDGALGGEDDTSSAAIAKLLGLGVVLVVDVAKMAQSAAALISGFQAYDPAVELLGVVLNRISSDRHKDSIVKAIQKRLDIAILGVIPRLPNPPLKERHLGLYLAHETDYGFLKTLGASMSLPSELRPTLKRGLGLKDKESKNQSTALYGLSRKERLGVAMDRAFLFYYEENLTALKELRLELIFFSPLHDRRLPDRLDGLYIGGGYPELFAGALSKNETMLRDIHRFALSGRLIYAECGGMVLLARRLLSEGKTYPMAGVLNTDVEFPASKKRMGYRRVRLRRQCLFGETDDEVLGHEFHYSGLIGEVDPKEAPYELFDSSGNVLGYEGFMQKNVLASYVHIYFRTIPSMPNGFSKALHEGLSY